MAVKKDTQQLTTSDFYQLMRFISEKQSIGYKLDLFQCVENFTVRTVTMVREADIEEVDHVDTTAEKSAKLATRKPKQKTGNKSDKAPTEAADQGDEEVVAETTKGVPKDGDSAE